MRLVRNAGNDRVLDLIQAHLAPGRRLDLMSDAASLFAFEAIRASGTDLVGSRWIVPGAGGDLALLGDDADRPARNRLQAAHVARQMAEWLRQSAEVRAANCARRRTSCGPAPARNARSPARLRSTRNCGRCSTSSSSYGSAWKRASLDRPRAGAEGGFAGAAMM